MKLSVFITTYNHEPYLAQALDGVLAQQTNFDYEIVVGEDKSTDGTRKILEDYARTLNLPVLEASADGYVRRDAEDLDKSIKELAAEGKIEHAFDADATPPRGLLVGRGAQGGQEALEVTIKARGVPLLLCFFGVPFVIGGVIFAVGLDEFPVFGIAFAIFGLLISHLAGCLERRL